MNHVWTWGGEYFGYIDGDRLWTHDGRNVGRLQNDEICAPNGRYLGEIKNDNRLITNLSKQSRSGSAFAPYGNRVGLVPFVNYVGYVMYVGHDDFPGPSDL